MYCVVLSIILCALLTNDKFKITIMCDNLGLKKFSIFKSHLLLAWGWGVDFGLGHRNILMVVDG